MSSAAANRKQSHSAGPAGSEELGIAARFDWGHNGFDEKCARLNPIVASSDLVALFIMPGPSFPLTPFILSTWDTGTMQNGRLGAAIF